MFCIDILSISSRLRIDLVLTVLVIMEVPEEAVQKIQKFAQNRQTAEKESAREPLSATALHAYTRRLDGTLRELQEQVRRQEEELKKVTSKLQRWVGPGGTNSFHSFGRCDPMA